jgi:hypothetical protein
MNIDIIGFLEAKKELERNLSAHTDEIIEHLFKLILMPDSRDRNHWQGEIAGQLNKIVRLNNSKKFPKAKQIYQWTYGKKQDLVTDRNWLSGMLEDIEFKYNIEVCDSIDNLIYSLDDLCVTYFSWLAENLSESGYVSTPKIYRKLDELT